MSGIEAMEQHRIRPVGTEDRAWVHAFTVEQWHAEIVVAHGVAFRPEELPGFLAEDASGRKIGLVTWATEPEGREVVTLNSLEENRGVGTALLEAARTAAVAAGCRRLRLITTNDNLRALRFCRKRGFCLFAVYPGALDVSRLMKPSIPLVGMDSIPLRDEIELRWSPEGAA